jgi:stage IV sporulation protein FB
MRDPLTWSFPLGRMFGIRINAHILLPVVLVALILRVTVGDKAFATLAEALVMSGVLLLSVLLHEFGHCFAARSVDGDAVEVLLWPLGGLASCDVPHTPRANLITALGGPAMNLALCVAAGGALLFAGLIPPLSLLNSQSAFQPQLREWRTNQTWQVGVSHYRDPADAAAKAEQVAKADPATKAKDTAPEGRAQIAPAPPAAPPSPLMIWQILAGQVFWINWFLMIINMVLVGFPFDAGRVLQCILWARSDYRQGTTTACYAGFVVMLVLFIVSVFANEVLVLFLALFVYVNCRQQLILLETGGEDAPFGYDFSQGYTSLEGGQPPATTPRRKRPNWFQRWLQRRAALKARREHETREAEERRMDELLEKVQRHGIQSLSDEERRFLTRVSARYRGNKS